MNREQAQGQFEQMKGRIKQAWGKLTDDDISLYEGHREEFFGKLHEKYGLAKEEAEAKLRRIEQVH